VTARAAAVGVLAWYKRWISPMLPPACRFEPTCSEYAQQAITIHGVWRGARMTVWRVLRCQPFSRGGFDPVPEE
jgi:putative membrane protein insertion efficiency factor